MKDSFVAEAPRPGAARQDVNRAADKPQESSRQDAMRPDSARRDTQAMTPRVDVLEDDTGITVVADMPGVTKDSLEIKVENDALSIEGQCRPLLRRRWKRPMPKCAFRAIGAASRLAASSTRVASKLS
jgi:HSP20 family molecular chaperone IbpA